MIFKAKVTHNADSGCLLGAKQVCNHIGTDEIGGGVFLAILSDFKCYVCGIKLKVIW